MNQTIATDESGLSAADLAVIEDEERLLSGVQEAIAAAREEVLDRGGLLERIKELREEAAGAVAEDLPALLDQLHTHQALAGHRPAITRMPDRRSPYFARMRLRQYTDDGEPGQAREILLGYRTFIDEARGVTIIDWRHAPVARVFYTYREGDDYVEEFPGGVKEGTVQVRRVLTIEDGRLVRIVTPGRTLVRREGGPWEVDRGRFAPRFAGGEGAATRQATRLPKFGVGATGRPAPEVAALLDPEQYALLQVDDRTPVLVLGGAGSGKTTVALHRLAALAYRDPERYRQNNMLVVVPEPGLARLSKKLLISLGMDKVRVNTFDDWIRGQASNLLRRLSRRYYEATPARVIRFKRHPALLTVLDEVLARSEAETLRRLRRAMPADPEIAERVGAASKSRPLLERFDRAVAPVLAERANPIAEREVSKRLRERQSAVQRERDRLFDLAWERAELFSDRDLLMRSVRASNGELTPGMVDEVIEHTRGQLADKSDEDYSGYDPLRAEALDKRTLAESTPYEAAGTIDVEDLPILFELLRRKAGAIRTPGGRMPVFAHMVIDEAQDMAPAELMVLGQALRRSSAVTIAGDAAQQIDPAHSFDTWEHVLDLIGVRRAHSAHLKTSYRSPRPIAMFAHKVLGDLAPAEPPLTVRDGVPVSVTRMAHEGHEVVFLTEVLSDLLAREPRASVAVIARTAQVARRLFAPLSRLAKTRLVLRGEFDFKPGIDVTNVGNVKGLEFDYVIIPDADGMTYPDTPESRRALHVAATRAIHQLWVIAVGAPSPVLPANAE
ncbi:ATP-binding domain-containing protein [bacterium]|nr:ATP-binding domain-containing protein [bacterium]